MKLIDFVKRLDMDTVIRLVSPDTGFDEVYLGIVGDLTVGMVVKLDVLSIEVTLERDSKLGEIFPVMEITVATEE